MGSRTGYPAIPFNVPDDLVLHPINTTYGDELESVPLSGSWTKRNIAQSETLRKPIPAAVTITLDAAGDYIYRSLPTGDFEMIASLSALAGVGSVALVGLGCVDSSNGNGLILSPFSGTTYLWTLTSWVYPNDANLGSAVGVPTSTEYWLRLKRVGNVWTGYHSSDGTTWVATSTTTKTIANPTAVIGASNGSYGLLDVVRFNVYITTYP